MEGKNNNIITTILVVVLIAASFYIGKLTTEVKQMKGNDYGNALNEPSDEVLIKSIAKLTEKDHVRGNRNAKIALVEYSDIECPYCQQFHPTAKKVMEAYGNDVMWVYRHFPLDQIHPNARPAAIATECMAKLQGEEKFWEYLDKLYDSGSLSEVALIEQAKGLGADETAFKACLTDPEMAKIVDDQQQGGIDSGVNGTPGNILVNAEKWEVATVLQGAEPLASVTAKIDALLGK